MTGPTLRDQIQFAYEGGLTWRFHTCPGLRINTNAAHQHGVAMMCYWLSGGAPRSELLMAALTHDAAEQVVGDVPAPTKQYLGAEQLDGLEEDARRAYGLAYCLTDDEKRRLALADALDGLLYCSTELTLGNRRFTMIGSRWVGWIIDGHKKTATAHEWAVAEAVLEIWLEAENGAPPRRFDLG